MSHPRPLVLLVGLASEVHEPLKELLKSAEVISVPMEIEQLLKPISGVPCLILTSPSDSIPANELAQALHMQYQSSPLFLCCTVREKFERKSSIKNGFTDAFLFPSDFSTLKNSVAEILAKATQGEVKVYRPVKIIDVNPGDVLDFDTNLYLPMNSKYVKLSVAGDALDPMRIEKMKKSKLNSVYVPAEQMQSFYQYSARRLQSLGTGAISATERKEKLTAAVRELVSGLFTQEASSFEAGQGIMKDCGEIVKSFIVQGGESEWFLRIQQVIGNSSDSYSHSANVSTLAALFSMGLGIGKPEDMALAGMLHDIGIAELPAEIQLVDPSEMNAEQTEAYKTHVMSSVNLIKSRKIIVPEIVSKAILQHHERYNGSGYPSGLFGDRISKEAQILALADHFDDLTSLKEGRRFMTPAEAVEQIRSEQVNDPARILFNPELVKNLLALFPA